MLDLVLPASPRSGHDAPAAHPVPAGFLAAYARALVVTGFAVLGLLGVMLAGWCDSGGATRSAPAGYVLVADTSADTGDAGGTSADSSGYGSSGEISSAGDSSYDSAGYESSYGSGEQDSRYTPSQDPAPASPVFDSSPGLSSEPAPDVAPVSESDPAPAAGSDPAPASDTDPAPVSESDPAPGSVPDVVPASDSDPVPAAGSDPAPASDSGPAPAAGSDPAPAPSPAPEPVPVVDPVPVPDTSVPAAEAGVPGSAGSPPTVSTEPVGSRADLNGVADTPDGGGLVSPADVELAGVATGDCRGASRAADDVPVAHAEFSDGRGRDSGATVRSSAPGTPSAPLKAPLNSEVVSAGAASSAGSNGGPGGGGGHGFVALAVSQPGSSTSWSHQQADEYRGRLTSIVTRPLVRPG